MREYDVFLNSLGYHLARQPGGGLLSSSALAQHSDLFSNYFSEQERWKLATFTFEDGAGLRRWAPGERRYRWGVNIDTRSGDVIKGIFPTFCDGGADEDDHLGGGPLPFVTSNATLGDVKIDNSGTQEGYAILFSVPNTGIANDIRTVGILVRRDPDVSYSGANPFTVEIQGQDPITLKPDGIVAATTTVALDEWPNEYQPLEDLWRRGEYFWLEVSFTYAGRATGLMGGDYYYLCVFNDQAPPLYWAEAATGTGGWCASYDSAGAGTWTLDTMGPPVYAKVKSLYNIDGQVRAFASFRGTSTLKNPGGAAPTSGDGTRRVYAAVGPTVMYYDEVNSWWSKSKSDFTNPVLDLVVFNNALFAAQGDNADIYWSDGASATGTWTAISGHYASVFAVHDNLLWKGLGSWLSASASGTSWVPASALGTIGDPGSPITGMVSHGGNLYVVKPEGVFEIYYPDTFPGDANQLVGTMVLDFSTEIAPRPWCLDWHGGLYFPGVGGVFSWANSILSDIWSEAVDNEAEIWPGLVEGNPGAFQAALGATRGLILARSNPYVSSPPQLYVYHKGHIHPLYSDSMFGEHCLAMFLEGYGGGAGRLWWGLGHEILETVWPTWTNDREMDEASTYMVGQGVVRLPYFEGERPDTLKDWYEVRIRSEGLGEENTDGGVVKVHYRYDEDGLWYTLPYTFSESPFDSVRFPANTSSYFLDMQLELTTVEGQSPTGTPRIMSVTLVYQPLPDTLSTFQIVVGASTEHPLAHGGSNYRDAATQYAELKALLERAEPFTYLDPLGNSQEVRVLHVGLHDIRSVLGDGPLGKKQECIFVVTLLKVADAAESAISGGAAYQGDGP